MNRIAQAARIADYGRLGLEPTHGYMDGVVRMARKVDERVDLVVFIGDDGSSRGVQVWIDGSPEECRA